MSAHPPDGSDVAHPVGVRPKSRPRMQPSLCPLITQQVHASSPGAACACRYPLDIFGAGNAAMKQALRRGGPADLNIYVTQLNNGGIIGCGFLTNARHKLARAVGPARRWMGQASVDGAAQ